MLGQRLKATRAERLSNFLLVEPRRSLSQISRARACQLSGCFFDDRFSSRKPEPVPRQFHAANAGYDRAMRLLGIDHEAQEKHHASSALTR